MLFDSHAHLIYDDYDTAELVSNFERDKISKVLTVGYDLESSLAGAEIAAGNDRVYAAVGVHPHSASTLTEEMCAELADIAKNNPRVVAFGEIGLDYYRDRSPRDVQRRAAVRQIELAHQLKLPVIFHIRDAYGDMRQIITDNISKIQRGGLLHCYSGSVETAREYIKDGFYISFSGVITFRNAKFDDIIRAVPLDKILIETDCPYLAPEPYRGKTNQPAYVYFVAKKIGEVLGKSTEEIAKITHDNACRFLRIAL